MPRTSTLLVQGILNNDTQTNWDGVTDLSPFIAAATNIVTRVIACAGNKGIVLTNNGQDSEAEIVERWLAAHLYCINDPLYKSRSTQGASGAFQRGSDGKGFASTDYGQTAMTLDWSGCLKNLNEQQRFNTAWLGRQPLEQMPARARNDN